MAPSLSVGSMRHGIKTGIATLLAFLIAEWCNFGYGYWAPISAVFVMQTNIAESIALSLYRTVGTVIGALMGIISMVTLPDTFVGNCIGLFIMTGLCAFLTRWDARYRMAAITVTIVILASSGQVDRIEFGIFRVLEILIGVCSALLVSVTLWPRPAGVVLEKDLLSQIAECADKLDELTENFLTEQHAPPKNFLHILGSKLATNAKQLASVRRHESLIYRYKFEELETFSSTVESAVTHMQVMLHSFNSCRGNGCVFIFTPEMRSLAQSISAGLRWITNPNGPTPDFTEIMKITEERLVALRKSGAPQRLELHKIIQFYAFYDALYQFAEDMETLVKRRQKALNK